MKGLKEGFKGGITVFICALITLAIANKFKSNAYVILFLGGILTEKISCVIEGD